MGIIYLPPVGQWQRDTYIWNEAKVTWKEAEVKHVRYTFAPHPPPMNCSNDTATLHPETNAENWITAPIFIEYRQYLRMVLSLWNGITIHIFAGAVNSDCKIIPLGKPLAVAHRKVACYTLPWFLRTYMLCIDLSTASLPHHILQSYTGVGRRWRPRTTYTFHCTKRKPQMYKCPT